MLRKIVRIDEGKCDGCGACVPSCAEGAIAVVNGKARLQGDVLCDGLGACLGECPRGAIAVVEREAAPFDEAAVRAHLAGARGGAGRPAATVPAGPGRSSLPVLTGPPPAAGRPHLSVPSAAASPAPASPPCPGSRPATIERAAPAATPSGAATSRLGHWPVQLHLVSPSAPYFRGSDLLVAADCVPFAYARFHDDFLAGRAVVVGCPKLDDVSPYAAKLAALIGGAGVRSVTVVRMEVPCCGGIARLVQRAMVAAGRDVPFRDVIVGTDGAIRSDR